MPEQHQLTDLQIAVLRLIWDRGEATVADVWEALHPERRLAQTTIATILSRLQRRGVVARRTRERQFVYRALVSEEDVQHSMVNELTERLFAGDVAALMSHLLNAGDMSPGDLARVREMIRLAESKKGAEK